MKIKHRQQAPTTFTIDADGQRLAHVALANSQQRATLYADDYERLIAAGFSRFWKLTADGCGSAYATLNAHTREGHNREVPIARLVVEAKRGERVRSTDGQTLNLRRENLASYEGRARFDASDWFPSVEALRAAGIEPVQEKNRTKRSTRRRDTPDKAPHGAATVAPVPPTQHAPCTTPASTPRAPQEMRDVQPPALMPPPVAHVPRVIDRAAISARVRDQLAQQRNQQ